MSVDQVTTNLTCNVTIRPFLLLNLIEEDSDSIYA